ncbi:MAG: sigma-70 family RNA polymerase sigma factor [Gammaproteobacteria bacterium]|nr:sigma-70 family RNA polymerase sigma factor [Gammaproteobacteria bacterium]
MAVDDDELMTRYQAGNADAFETLYSRHKGPLYRYFLRQVPRECVDDLFQEAWLRIVNSAPRYVRRGAFRSYLYRIAHSILVDFYRRHRRMQTNGDDVDVPDPGAGPAAAHEQTVLRERLAAALRSLPPPQREAFLLHQEAGLTLEQIADVVGSSRETVKSRLRYATARLKRELRDDDAEAMERSA